MSTPYTVDELSDQLDTEFTWRRIELSTLLTLLQRSNIAQRDAVGRAAFVSLYAHWEGFVREAVQLYLHHVSCKSMPLRCLPIGMAFAWNPDALSRAQNMGSNPILKSLLVAEMDDLKNRRIRNNKPDVDTHSNLSLAVLKEIDCLVGNIGLYKDIDKIWLDEKLLKKRNTIAHGRSASVDLDEFKVVLDHVTIWMQEIKAKLVNAAVLESYRIAA